VPDLQAIDGRVGKASMGIAVVRTGVDCVQQLALEKSHVTRSWARRMLDAASHLFWRSGVL
jgi:hypothetical protein